MLKTTFATKIEYDFYIIEQRSRLEKGYLTRSEREQLKQLEIFSERYLKKSELRIAIVTDLTKLNQACELVTKEDDIKSIASKLKEAHAQFRGFGLAANQIGINKQIAYIAFAKTELIIINPKIVSRMNLITYQNERCLSLPHISINTDRYFDIDVEYLNERLEPKKVCLTDLEAIIFQHEIDHLNGITILNRKHKAR